MECETCKLHCKYLERIIESKNEEILFLRSTISLTKGGISQPVTSISENVHVKDSVFDIMDYKTDQLDVSFLLSELNNRFPAKQNIANIIQYFIIDSDYNHLFKRNNEVKYIDKDNKVHLDKIEDFSKTICSYIFDQLKIIISSNCNSIDSRDIMNDQEYEANNVRVENFMILKDHKVCVDLVKQIFKNNMNS